MSRGGKREGAGRPPVPDKLINWTVRVHEHEKPLVKSYLKKIRQVKQIVEEVN